MITFSVALMLYIWSKLETTSSFPLGYFFTVAVLADIAIVGLIFAS